jgi:hypothetical protein
MGHKGLVTATRKIHTAIRSVNSSPKTSDHYKLFMKITPFVTLVNAPNKIFWIISVFLLFLHLLPIISAESYEFTALTV